MYSQDVLDGYTTLNSQFPCVFSMISGLLAAAEPGTRKYSP